MTGTAAALKRPRRRGMFPATTVAEPRGKRVGEMEEVTAELTTA